MSITTYVHYVDIRGSIRVSSGQKVERLEDTARGDIRKNWEGAKLCLETISSESH